MNLTQLRVFDTVMRTGSVTAAALRLHVTQPAVTNHLKALEQHYDVNLFRRQGRHLRATRLGHELAEISGRLFALDEQASNLLEATRKLEHGAVRIASDGPYLLIPIVKAFRERFPGVRVEMQIANTETVQAMLIAERCDVTIQGQREADSRIHSRQLADFELIIFVHENHIWAQQRRDSINIKDLDGPGIVVREQGSTTRRILDLACETAGFTANYIIETTSRETVKEAVAAGLGIGAIPDYELGDDARFWPLRVLGADLTFAEAVQCLNRRRTMRVVREFLTITEEVVASGNIPTALQTDD
jgi:aminoethylphosphonate catabolism LysR family transcriptional regulator